MKKKLILLIVFVLCMIIPSAYAYSEREYIEGIGMRIDQVTDNRLVNVAQRTYVGDGKWDESAIPLLLGDNREVGDKIVSGKAYPLRLSLANIGEIDTYNRMTVHRYFMDQNGHSDDINPSQIEYKYPIGFEKHFIIDESATTTEKNFCIIDIFYPRVRWINLSQVLDFLSR